MIVKFAYTNDFRFEYDIAAGLKLFPSPIVEFEIDIASYSPLQPESASPFQRRLLDGNTLELGVKRIGRQTLTTYPDLVLAGDRVKIGATSEFLTYRVLIENWNYALARWVTTDELAGSSSDSGYRKVVRGAETLDFEQVGGISFALRATLNLVTAGAS